MSNIEQNKIQNEIWQINKEINFLQDRLNAHKKKTGKKRTKDGSFSNQRNTKYSSEYIAK